MRGCSMGFRFLSIGMVVIGLLIGTAIRADEPPSTANLGKKIRNFALTDAQGKAWSLYDLKDQKAIVVVFLSFECPVSTSYSQPLADMAAEFGKSRVAFVGLTTNADETPAEVAKQARIYKLPFPCSRMPPTRARTRCTPR